ncbi:MAG: slipin family protein [Flavobacteriales bacterium]|nr:slipin family protein [Flavobacteriales bacterium]
MFTVKIKFGKIGLVYRYDELVSVLTQGKHFINPFTERVVLHDAEGQLNLPIQIEELLQNEKIRAICTLVEVADNNICLVTKNGLYEVVLNPGRYLFLNETNVFTFTNIDLFNSERVTDGAVLKYAENQLSNYVRKLEVDVHEEALLLVDGEYKTVLQAGKYFFYKNNVKLAIQKVDTRMQAMEVGGQEMLTKDKANLRLNFNLQYRVTNTFKAVLENREYEKQLYLIAQLLLREIVGTLTLDELLENKEVITEYVMTNIVQKASSLGVEVINAGVKDLVLPGDMKEILNQVLVAQKKAQANVITRREEVASTRSLLNTAKLLEENATLMRLKEMEYLERIAEKVGEITVAGGTDVLKQLKAIF